ncbi:ubiquitin carboxyl-terminal hydrolase 47-like isoform X2 [Palaemon carinicauda]|uniref:ubiquitin carboxyl-terminal hydrolase 47-like isoform X2 n=1 Tax=Palaemon carinicauda TaxID=392227 RepID=UPI0035B61DBE
MMADPQTINSPPHSQQPQVPPAVTPNNSNSSSSYSSRSSSCSPVRGVSRTAWDTPLDPLLEILRLRLLRVMKSLGLIHDIKEHITHTESIEDGGGGDGGGGGGGGITSTQTQVTVDSNATSTTTVTDTPEETATKTTTSKFTKTTKVKTIKIVKKRNSLVANAISEINNMADPQPRKILIKKSESPKKLPGSVKKISSSFESESDSPVKTAESKVEDLETKKDTNSIDSKDSSKTEEVNDSKTSEESSGSENSKVTGLVEPDSSSTNGTVCASEKSNVNEVSEVTVTKEAVKEVATPTKEAVKEVATPSKEAVKEVTAPTKEAVKEVATPVKEVATPGSRIIAKINAAKQNAALDANRAKSVDGLPEPVKPKFIRKRVATKVGDQASGTRDASPSKSSSTSKEGTPLKSTSKDGSPSKSATPKEGSPLKSTTPKEGLLSKSTTTPKDGSPAKLPTTTNDGVPSKSTDSQMEESTSKEPVTDGNSSSATELSPAVVAEDKSDQNVTSTSTDVAASCSANTDAGEAIASNDASELNATKKTKSSSALSTRPKKFVDVPKISKTKSTDAVSVTKLKVGSVTVNKKAKSADDVNLEKASESTEKEKGTIEKVAESKENVSSCKSTLSSVEDVSCNSVASGELSEAALDRDSSKLSESPSVSDDKIVTACVTVTSESDDHADAGSSSCEGATGITVSEASKTSDVDSLESELSNVSVFVIVRDMSGLTVVVTKVTIVTPATSTCGELMQEVGRRFKYEPESFSLVLQCSDGSQVEIEKMEPERTLADAKFQTEGTPRNNCILCDLNGHLPRRTDEDDLSLGASASPTANATERKWFERSTNYENTSTEYSYSSALIKHDTGYAGLVNQAMTCYLNSLLQTLYMTPEFRNALYQWEFKGSEEEASKNIPCQLQRLFLLLQTTNKSAVETTNLTKSFGWDSSEAWQQHDIQELCRVMFDALEQCFKNTHQANLINDLYEGKMSDYVKCLECGNEGAREDTYLDIPLPIRPFGSSSAYKSVEEALKAFVEPELLTGNNKYKCSKCNSLCDAHKGLKFTHFPYLLTIHLMRFDFDYNTLHRIKLNDKVTFPSVLDLNSFTETEGLSGAVITPDKPSVDKVDDASTTDSGSALDVEDSSVENTSNSLHESDNQDEDEGIDVSSIYNEKNKSCLNNGRYVYELFSIMVHSGSASGGHYYAYIKDFRTGEWFCFNDQSVSKITYNDIRKTYGGSSTRGGYYSSWSSSANAYMLMYRQITKEKNVHAYTKDELPQHIKDLVQRMTEEEAAEREQREIERCMCRIKLFCQLPGQNQMAEKKLRIHKDSTLREATKQAYEEMGLQNIVPIERCRLVKYEEFHDSLECSFEGQEDELISEILGGVRNNYKFDLLLEIRDEDKAFEVYKPGGTTIKAHIVNLTSEEVEGPYTLRGSLSMTVRELKELVGRALNLNPDTMRIVLERYYNDLRPLSTDSKTLKVEGFYRSNKIYVEASGKEANDFFTGSCMYHILDRHENTITLYCPLPDTSKEALEELQIPAYKEEEIDPVEVAETSVSANNSGTATTSFVDSPADSAASPASCSSKDSGISSKGPNDMSSRDMASSSNSSIVSNSSEVSASSPSTSSSTIPSPGTSSTSQESTSSMQGVSASTSTASPFATSAGNGSDGEDEGIADADSGAGSSNVNSDQSASEDSSLTSDSDRTLVGEPPEDKLSDASNSPDYGNVSSPEDNSRDTKDNDAGWGEDEKELETKRYFRAEYFTEEETNQKMLRVHVDKRITMGQLKKEMQKWVGVSSEHFKLFKIYSNSQEFECTRMTETLASYGDNTRLNVRLGRALLPGEQRGKVYLLEPDNIDDPARFLIDWVVTKGESIGNAKRAIVKEVNTRCNMTLTPELVRLRKKSWKNPQAIYLDDQKFDDDISLYSNWELFLQVLEGPETKSHNIDEVALFVRRWKPSTYTLDPLKEVIIPKPTMEELKEKLSELSGIDVENVEVAKGKGTFPCDMSVLDISDELDWTPRVGQLNQRPLYILDDGAMMYFRDKSETLKELTDEERRELNSSENRRLNRDLQYSCPSSTTNYSNIRSKERGLKIYLNHDD